MLAALVDPVATHPSLTLKDVPTPAPLPGWVLVDLHRAALNRLDAMMIETRTELDRPTIFGADGAGTIHAVGAGVDPGLLGTEVVISPSLQWGSSSAAPGDAYEILGAPTDGTHAEYVAVPAENVFAKPARLTWSEAAALPMAGLTAWRALVTRGRLRDGETVVIAAATSGVGSMAIQIAKGLGAQVIAITSTDDKADAARALGADDVVLRSRADFGGQLVDATGGQAHLALDPTGALWQPLLQSLAFGGRLAVVGRMAAATGSVQVQTVYWKQVDILGSSMGSPQDFTALLAHVAASVWRPAIDSEYDLADIEAAYARLDAPDRVGKVILRTETLR